MSRREDKPLESLEGELRQRASARNAELVVGTDPDGRCRAAFTRFVDGVAPTQGIELLAVTAIRKRVAFESLLTADTNRSPES